MAIECPDPFPGAGSGGQSPQAEWRVRISALGVRVGSPGLHDPAETPTLPPCAEIPLRGIPLGSLSWGTDAVVSSDGETWRSAGGAVA